MYGLQLEQASEACKLTTVSPSPRLGLTCEDCGKIVGLRIGLVHTLVAEVEEKKWSTKMYKEEHLDIDLHSSTT